MLVNGNGESVSTMSQQSDLKAFVDACPGISERQRYVPVSKEYGRHIRQAMRVIFHAQNLVIDLPKEVQQYLAELARIGKG